MIGPSSTVVMTSLVGPVTSSIVYTKKIMKMHHEWKFLIFLLSCINLYLLGCVGTSFFNRELNRNCLIDLNCLEKNHSI
jgi:hypothetical protein